MGAMQQSLIATAKAAAATLDTVTFVDAGAFFENIAGITITPPQSYINNDLLVLVITSTNQTITTPTDGGTWTEVSNSPQSTGTAGASQSIRVAVYTKIASGSQANVGVTDTGVLTTGQMFSFRRVDQTTPVEVTSGSVLATAGTTHTLPAVTTSTNNAMIAHISGIGRDANTTVNYSSPTNANLTDLLVVVSRTVSTANGGGIGLVTGTKTTSGSTGTTSVTVAASSKGAFVTLGVKPSAGFDTTLRVLGCFSGVANSKLWGEGSATSSLTLESNGSITVVGEATLTEGLKWVNNPATSVGNNYWVKATTITGSGTGTVGSWLQLNTARTWSVFTDAGGGVNSWNLKMEFSTDSGGSTIVATNVLDLFSSTESEPTVGTVLGIIP
jgi:hypothetical protein